MAVRAEDARQNLVNAVVANIGMLQVLAERASAILEKQALTAVIEAYDAYAEADRRERGAKI